MIFLSNNHKAGQKGQQTERENNSTWDDVYNTFFPPWPKKKDGSFPKSSFDSPTSWNFMLLI